MPEIGKHSVLIVLRVSYVLQALDRAAVVD
jgi:hypothetical protein